jgi:hypothetical protein
MIPLPDGTFRYSPRDLVAYLEGDFAAWCDRMHGVWNPSYEGDRGLHPLGRHLSGSG